jgi:hypothetical protein
MIYIEKAKDSNGVFLKGDFFDLDRLYFAIFKFTGYHGMDDQCVFPGCAAICESLLGLCYEMRHAWQGERGLEQVYNGIHNDWFDDYQKSEVFLDDDDDDAFNLDDSEGDNSQNENSFLFSREDFPEANEHNTYFSIHLSFPEVIYYTLILSDLLGKKELFYQAREALMKTKAEPLQELNKEYYFFEAEVDVARITIFVNQALHSLYQFIGEKKYFAFINKFKKIDDYSVNCNMNAMNEAMTDYGMKEFEQDDPDTLMRTLAIYLK